MKLSDYSYELPDSLIAIQPPRIRGTSNLLVLNRQNGKILDKKYVEISDFLEKGDVLVLNNTKVIKARLDAVKSDGTHRELLVLEKHSYDDNWFRHRVLYRRKLTIGDEFKVGSAVIVVEELLGDGIAVIKSTQNILDIANQFGSVPLPPYMHRSATESDIHRYQTVWAKSSGSVAAPTASLNMTDEIITTLKNKGVEIVYLTLHVGLGTFLPIRTDIIEDHKMHKEYFEIPSHTVDIIQHCKCRGGKVIALGTTVARTLEYAYKYIDQKPNDISGEADIFIYPGYDFKVIDGLLTNFHTPKSTVLMLTAAFAGWDKLLLAYEHAIDRKYNFLSYGDSMLIL